MDAQHHATIADKLMQYRGKLPKHTNPSNRIAVGLTYDLKKHIEDLIAHHEEEEEERIAALEESVKWYEAEMVKVGGISLNPLSWKKKRDKGK